MCVTIGLEFWQLLVLVFYGVLRDVLGEAVRISLLPDLALTAKILLEQANTAQPLFRGVRINRTLFRPIWSSVLQIG